VAQDESSIKAFFEKYANADFDDPETRDTVLSYFIDKIYLYDDGHFKVTGWYWDFEHEIKSDLFEDLPERASGFEYSLDLDPEGFACFADGSTTDDTASPCGEALLLRPAAGESIARGRTGRPGLARRRRAWRQTARPQRDKGDGSM
jgi:hypothetical protein